MKINNDNETKAILKMYIVAQIFLWVAFAVVMIGVGVLGHTILTTGPKTLSVIGIIILFMLSFVLGATHGHVTWQVAKLEEMGHNREEAVT